MITAGMLLYALLWIGFGAALLYAAYKNGDI